MTIALETKLDLAKLLRDGGITRDGRAVTIYTVNHDSEYPIHGAVKGMSSPLAWYPNGRFMNPEIEYNLDLLNKV